MDYSYRNDTNRVSWWWSMTDWWWKVGFTPRATRLVRHYWQLSSLGVISYLWVLSLETASWGAHTLGTFQKYPLFSPPSTTSGIFGWSAMAKNHAPQCQNGSLIHAGKCSWLPAYCSFSRYLSWLSSVFELLRCSNVWSPLAACQWVELGLHLLNVCVMDHRWQLVSK